MILRCLGKPLKLQSYDKIRDTYEHVQHVDNILNYFCLRGSEVQALPIKYNRNRHDVAQNHPSWEHRFMEGSS